MLEQAENIGLHPAPGRDAAGAPVLDEEENVLHKFERLQLVIGDSADQGEGTLFITERRIFWLSAAQPGLGYCCDFPTIAMHAVATDEESANRACLYIQLDRGNDEGGLCMADSCSSGGSEEEEGEGEGEGEVEGDELLPELRLIPADGAQLEPIFQAFCEGAERNPDLDEGDEDEGLFYNQDEVLAGAAQAMAIAQGDVEELVGEDLGRFEDAEGEEEEVVPAPQPRQPNGGC